MFPFLMVGGGYIKFLLESFAGCSGALERLYDYHICVCLMEDAEWLFFLYWAGRRGFQGIKEVFTLPFTLG